MEHCCCSEQRIYSVSPPEQLREAEKYLKYRWPRYHFKTCSFLHVELDRHAHFACVQQITSLEQFCRCALSKRFLKRNVWCLNRAQFYVIVIGNCCPVGLARECLVGGISKKKRTEELMKMHSELRLLCCKCSAMPSCWAILEVQHYRRPAIGNS